MQLIENVVSHHDEATAWRRHLHSRPELQFDLQETASFVKERLGEFGIDDIAIGIAQSGVVAVIEGRKNSARRSIGLRADMDALPIHECTGLDYASIYEGRMHACGHDGHTTMLLAAARHLAHSRQFDGCVVLVFQPAEELGGGGRVMIEEGLLSRWRVDRMFGMHTWAGLDAGKFSICAGPMLAASGRFDVVINSKGGHAAFPHKCVDPISIGRRLIDSFDSIVSRETDPLDALVVSTTKFEAGHAYNVISDTAILGGNIRALSDEVYESAVARMAEMTKSFSELFECFVDFKHTRGYPTLVNEVESTEIATKAAIVTVGANQVSSSFRPIMGAEDFAFMLQKVPGAFMAIGQGDGPFMHHPEFDFNDEIIPIGASYWCRLVEETIPLT